MSKAQPIQPSERADILDILRGFALLGIFLANSAVFSQYVMQAPAETATWPTASIDKVLSWVHFALIDGKFYSLFSLLFGIGFSVFLYNKKAAGNDGILLFYRRLAFLMLFGIAHIYLLWDGDILLFYAVFGMLLPAFRNVSNRALISIAVVLLLSPILVDTLKIISEGKWNIANPFFKKALATDASVGITEENARNWLIVHKDYDSILDWNRSGFWWSAFLRLDSNRPMKVLAMFLVGLYVGRNLIYTRLEAYKSLLKKVQFWGLGIGIVAGIIHAYVEFDGERLPKPAGIWDTVFYALNVTPLAMGYAATLALWYTDGKLNWLLLPLRHAGRMALTNYIMQSVMGIIIYYGIGLGLGVKAGPSLFMPVAVGVFIFQVLYSRIWLSYFQYGPLEWVWRMLTYGKWLPIAKKTTASGSNNSDYILPNDNVKS